MNGDLITPPLTPRCKKILALAVKAARDRNDNFVGPDHLILGLINEGESKTFVTLAGFAEIPRLKIEIGKNLDAFKVDGSATKPDVGVAKWQTHET